MTSPRSGARYDEFIGVRGAFLYAGAHDQGIKIRLPRVDENGGHNGGNLAARSVLVVEDADATRRLIELSLSMAGFIVIERTDGPSGLAAAQELLPAVIVLDIALPRMDGWEVLETLRADPRTQNIPVVVITAHDTAESRNHANLSRADAFFGKPFDINQLRALVARLASPASSTPATSIAG